MFAYLRRLASMILLMAQPYTTMVSYLHGALKRALGVLQGSRQPVYSFAREDSPSITLSTDTEQTPGPAHVPLPLPSVPLSTVRPEAFATSFNVPYVPTTIAPPELNIMASIPDSSPTPPLSGVGDPHLSAYFAMSLSRFGDPMDDWAEDFGLYRPGGYCPIALGSELNDGRFEVLHKLGSGGSATVWLALDNHENRLVAIKVLQADRREVVQREISMASALGNIGPGVEAMRYIRFPASTFQETSPNGTHTCLVQPLTGPSLNHLSPFGSVARIRANLVPRFAWQAASAIKLLHGMHIALHDITPANWALQVKEEVHSWSKEKLYSVLGAPVTYPLETLDGSALGPNDPPEEAESLNMCVPSMAPFLQDSIICIDLGDTVDLTQGKNDRRPTVPACYQAPEMLISGQIFLASDIWTLALFIFDMLTGRRLIQVSDRFVLSQQEALFHLPRGSLTEGGDWGDGGVSGISRVEEALRRVGHYDRECVKVPAVAPFGEKLEEEDIQRWTGILSRMLRLRPEERPMIDTVLEWIAGEFPHLI